MGAFGWIGQFFDTILSIIPRLILVRSTHRGVKWPFGGDPVELRPNLHLYWPIVTDYEVIVTARQTQIVPPQGLMTYDMKQVVAGALVVFEIDDVIKAIGKRNWDVESTVSDITQAAVVEVVTETELEDLVENISGNIQQRLTDECREQLAEFGVRVHRCALTQFSQCRVYNHVGLSTIMFGQKEEE